MPRYVGIAGVQMEVIPGEDNSPGAFKLLQTVASSFPWVDIVLFSELSVCGMSPAQKAPMPNALLGHFCQWAKKEKKWLIPGSFFEQAGRKVFNTAVVISPGGKIAAKYRKLFPWRPLEKNEAGKEFCVFDIPGKGRFGLCICYDQWFPEVVRTLTWMGAEAILHPSASYTSDRPQELVISQAQAIFNQVYFLSVNGVGAGGVGNSIFVDPEGRVLQVAGQRETILTEVIDLDWVQRVRENGTLGLSQLWKDLADFKQDLPIYRQGIRRGEIFRSLGPLRLHRKIRFPRKGVKGK